MFDFTASNVMSEVRASKEYIQPFLSQWDQEKEYYHGPGYRPQASKSDEYHPENHAFEWCSLVVPQLTFGNPRTKVSTSRIGSQRDVAKAIQFGLNRWSRDTRLRKLGEKLGVDYGMKWAVAITLPGYTEGFSDFEDPRNWPTAKRISPRRFIWDHLSTEMEECRFMGHATIRDKDDLLREAKDDDTWNMEALRALSATSSAVNEFRNEDYQEGYPARNEIAYYDLWFPEVNGKNVKLLEKYGIEPPKEKYVAGKHNGIWVTVGHNQDDEGQDAGTYLRDARWFWGPRSGPYTWIGAYVVPDEAAPLGPIPAVMSQAEELNDHARAVSRAMNVHKKGILVNANAGADFEDKIRGFEDHYVVAVTGLEELDKHVKEIELGGATETHLLHNNLLRARLDRNAGMSEVMRGNVGSNATATEVATADQSATIRFEHMIRKFQDGIQDILSKVAWYLYYDDKIHFALGEEAKGQFMEADELTGEMVPVEEAWFHGGEYDEESGATFDDLELEIEPFSMERTSEALQQRRMAELDATMANIVPLMAQFSFVNWDKYLTLRGEVMNLPNLGDIIDADAAREYAEMMTQVQLEGGGSERPQPRLQRDTGNLPQKTPGMDRGLMPGVMSGVDIGSGGVRQEGLTGNAP